MRNKNGDMNINELLSIIIAVIGILLLIYAGYRLYQVSKNDEMENAQKVLDRINDKISSLKDGEQSELTIQGFNGGNNWYLSAWGKSDDNRPDKCFFDSCVCICKWDGTGKFKDACQTQSVCQKVSNKKVYTSELITFNVAGENGDVFIPRYGISLGKFAGVNVGFDTVFDGPIGGFNCNIIRVGQNLRNFKITVNNGEINILNNYQMRTEEAESVIKLFKFLSVSVPGGGRSPAIDERSHMCLAKYEGGGSVKIV